MDESNSNLALSASTSLVMYSLSENNNKKKQHKNNIIKKIRNQNNILIDQIKDQSLIYKRKSDCLLKTLNILS